MKLSSSFLMFAGVALLAPVVAHAENTTPAAKVAEPAVPAATVTVPDLQTTSVSQLSAVASQALTALEEMTSKSSPALTEKINAVKAALAGNQASAALSSLAGLNKAAKGTPGAEGMASKATQVVSAWALKQGFDLAKISGVLGALQKPDYAALATQATSVLSKGDLTHDQKGLLNGVLNAYGIDASKAAGAANAIKGLFGK